MAGPKKKIEKNPSPELLKFREKRKWQIALRRYVIEGLLSSDYAPYFALDSKRMRNWFQMQFTEDMDWSNFGKKWQLDHIIPVVYFDFAIKEEMKLCWNFTNLRVEPIQQNKNRGNRVDVLAARNYFRELYARTNYLPCKLLLEKIDRIEISEILSSESQVEFLRKHKDYLELIEGYSEFEFEMLNRGRSVEDINKELEILRKIKI